jgi:hypothetical protein
MKKKLKTSQFGLDSMPKFADGGKVPPPPPKDDLSAGAKAAKGQKQTLEDRMKEAGA